jgi:16S rRNA G966 N2-methylase RsmD
MNKISIPFIGSKFRYAKKLKNIFNTISIDKTKNYNIYDVFGGSGACTIIFKDIFPNSSYTLNDYDKIITDDENNNIIDDAINKANIILRELRTVKKEEILNSKYKHLNTDEVNNILKKYPEIYENRMLTRFLSGNIMFNGRTLTPQTTEYYDRLRLTDYPSYYHNFNNVKIIHKDCNDMLNEIIDSPDNIIILDPPYICFNMKTTYKSYEYWTLFKYLEIIKYIYQHPLSHFVFFESSENNLTSLIDLINSLAKPVKYQKISLNNKEYVILINF